MQSECYFLGNGNIPLTTDRFCNYLGLSGGSSSCFDMFFVYLFAVPCPLRFRRVFSCLNSVAACGTPLRGAFTHVSLYYKVRIGVFLC